MRISRPYQSQLWSRAQQKQEKIYCCFYRENGCRERYVVTKLEIADYLQDGPKSVQEIAVFSQSNPESLQEFCTCLLVLAYLKSQIVAFLQIMNQNSKMLIVEIILLPKDQSAYAKLHGCPDTYNYRWKRAVLNFIFLNAR